MRAVVPALCVVSLCLYPLIHLKALQLLILAVVFGLMLEPLARSKAAFAALWRWPNIAFVQFIVFFLINAIVFSPLAGTLDHYRSVTIESWAGSLLAICLMVAYTQGRSSLKAAWITYAPLALLAVFCAAMVVYLSGSQGPRASLFTPNPLIPPLWFLIFALSSFCWFEEMSTSQKALRFVLFLAAGMMTVAGGARLVMIAWGLSGILLAVYFIRMAPAAKRLRYVVLCAIGLGVALALVLVVDQLTTGHLLNRFRFMFNSTMTYESLFERFSRLRLWSTALDVIGDNLMLGVGLINERGVLYEPHGEGWRLRAHQTYLSYLIAGGIPALISGLIFQAPTLLFAFGARARVMFPAFLGLGVVLTLNCLTDSVMQSATNVQIYLALMLVLLSASEPEPEPAQPRT